MKTYTLLTKPYKIRLTGQGHKMKHGLTVEDRWINFSRATEMWCCKVESEDHQAGVSLMVFNHSWLTTFKLESNALKNKWHVNEMGQGNWRDDLSILLASFDSQIDITNYAKP